MTHPILFRGARQLLTLQGAAGPRRGEQLRQLGIIEDGSVLVSHGVVTHVGPTRRLENLADARGAEEIDDSGRVIMPGFVDSHTQFLDTPGRLTGFNYPRSAVSPEVDIRRDHSYLQSASAKVLEAQGRRTAKSLLLHGTTTVETKCGYGYAESIELKCLKAAQSVENCLRVVTTVQAKMPVSSADERNRYLWSFCHEYLPKVRTRRLARFLDLKASEAGPHTDEAHYTLSQACSQGLVPRIQSGLITHDGGVQLGLQYGAASIDGLNFVTEEDCLQLAKSPTVATLLPGTVHQGSSYRFAPARQLIDTGVAVALATGYNPGISSTYNMQMAVSLACTHMNMSVEEAITAATINGAHAVLEAEQCGSLEFGKRADIIMLNVSDYREIPYHFGVNLVSLAMRAGEIAYRDPGVNCSSW